MDFGRAVAFAFDDPDWLKKIGLAALVCLIPLVGPIILLGWGLEITRRVINNDPQPLPDWNNFGEFLSKGFQAAVVSFAYVLPLILVAACGQGLTISLAATASNSNSDALGGIISILSLCMGCFIFIFALAASFIIPAAHGLLAATGELGAAFRFNEVFGLVRAAPGPYLLVLLGVYLANLILAPLGMVICGIGLLVTVAYTSVLSGHLTGQAYKAAKAALQTTTL
jgi:hypothetical protein